MFIPIIALVFGSVALSLAADYDRNGIAAWEEFKTKYSIEYGSIDEEIYRRHVFLENFEQFYNHNLKYEKGEVSFKIGTNQFADMTPAEMRSFTKCLILSPEMEWNKLEKHQQNFSTEIPKAVDWRNEGAVTPVKDQRNCGSCWAFSATGALEGQHAIKTKTLVSLSEQNLVDCDDNDNGCHGGDIRNAFKYVSEKGINTEESYPYEAKQGACRFNPKNVGAKNKGSRQVDPQEAALKAAVATVGPISVAIDDSDHHFKTYTGGIYTSSTCSTDLKDAGHAVLVVGYGTTPKGEDYWLVKNSWGHGWGEKGFIRMAMHKNICGIANYAIYPVM